MKQLSVLFIMTVMGIMFFAPTISEAAGLCFEECWNRCKDVPYEGGQRDQCYATCRAAVCPRAPRPSA